MSASHSKFEIPTRGRVIEWFMMPVLKTGDRKDP